jgi:hypothetical protein
MIKPVRLKKGGKAYFVLANAMAAFARTPVLPEATRVAALSARSRRTP